ncbi:hypothetical protein BZM27_25250 [Paraburkholderia steynii]|uniref:HTH gntR-type domain-containing protein n=1 Tax=Paraburkholderia steynii TaxID=1245441 RepID=A0A4R0XFL0_9BURK|nr:hypothetical protein BZM27_25250 [Paraburkholderia steynii]
MRRATEIDLALNARPDGVALQRWLYGELRAAILEGRLGPGARLPATRELAARHGVSRGTVLGVFAQLAAEGYLSGAVGRGSFVASELPDGRFESAPVSDSARHARKQADAGRNDGIALSRVAACWRAARSLSKAARFRRARFVRASPICSSFRSLCGRASQRAARGCRTARCSPTAKHKATVRCVK